MKTEKINRMLELATEINELSAEIKPEKLLGAENYELEKTKFEAWFHSDELLQKIIYLKNHTDESTNG